MDKNVQKPSSKTKRYLAVTFSIIVAIFIGIAFRIGYLQFVRGYELSIRKEDAEKIEIYEEE